jgi:hypothetical protein
MNPMFQIEVRGDDETFTCPVDALPRKGDTLITPFGHTMRVIDVVHAIPFGRLADLRVVGDYEGASRTIVVCEPT